jgi:hypothetical protein
METQRQLLEAHQVIRAIQGLAVIVLAYSAAHRSMVKEVGMREMWGWFAVIAIATLIGAVLMSRYLKDRAASIKRARDKNTSG